MKARKQGKHCFGTLHVNRKNVPPLVKVKYLKMGEWFGQHSGEVAVLMWHDKKRVTMISTYHTDEKHVSIYHLRKQHQRWGLRGRKLSSI
jgi:hypothetical protein